MLRRGNIVYDADLLNKLHVFKDRFNAGRRLAEACLNVFESNIDFIFAIPMGGVPVGIELARVLNSKLDLLICRKLLIPWNREAGFGAVDPDVNIFIDEDFAVSISLSEDELKLAIEEQLDEIEHRSKILRGGRPYPDLHGKTVVLVDDGVAAGYTMGAAINFVRYRGARRIFIAVPTGYSISINRLAAKVDLILCLNLRNGPWFAVADAYELWSDLSGSYVKELILSFYQR